MGQLLGGGAGGASAGGAGAGAAATGAAPSIASQTAAGTAAQGAKQAATQGGGFLGELLDNPAVRAAGERGAVSFGELGLGNLLQRTMGENFGGLASRVQLPVGPQQGPTSLLSPARKQDQVSPLERIFAFLQG